MDPVSDPLGSAIHEYAHGVMDRVLTAVPAYLRTQLGLGTGAAVSRPGRGGWRAWR
jgi:hypothetical protein